MIGGMANDSNTIVVGYDGSSDADLALSWATATARLTDRQVRVVVAGMDPDKRSVLDRDWDQSIAQDAASRVEVVVNQAAGENQPPSVTVDVVDGEPLEVLLEAADGAAMVVVGSQGHGPIEGRWVGSVSQQLVGHAGSDAVVVVRAAHHPGAKEIVVGVDGSPSSRRALDFACSRAEATGESVTAVHAYRGLRGPNGGLGGSPSASDVEIIDAAERTAAELIAGAAEDHPDVAMRATAVFGRASRVLPRLSDDASLIVVGTRGHNSLVQLVLGSVAQAALHRANCPVAVVR